MIWNTMPSWTDMWNTETQPHTAFETLHLKNYKCFHLAVFISFTMLNLLREFLPNLYNYQNQNISINVF